jgi:hypothetical protein
MNQKQVFLQSEHTYEQDKWVSVLMLRKQHEALNP